MKKASKQVRSKRFINRIKQVFHNKDRVLFFGIIILVTVMSSWFAASYPASQTKRVSGLQYGNANKILKSQEVAKTPAYTIQIISASENSQQDKAFGYEDSGTMLIASLAITNTTSVEQDILPSVQFYVRTTDGLYYQMHPSMFVTDPMQAGKIMPGAVIKGQISFVVPKSVTHPYLYLDLGWDGYTPAVYDILH